MYPFVYWLAPHDSVTVWLLEVAVTSGLAHIHPPAQLMLNWKPSFCTEKSEVKRTSNGPEVEVTLQVPVPEKLPNCVPAVVVPL